MDRSLPRLALLIASSGSLLVGACNYSAPNSPSLAPRPAEAIDPRLPVERALVERASSGALQDRLAALVQQARAGDVSYRAALGPAERAAAAAGPARSESWISAQQALSVLEASRSATTKAMGDIDALAGAQVKAGGDVGASDLAAIQRAAGEVAGLDRDQRATIGRLNARIGH